MKKILLILISVVLITIIFTQTGSQDDYIKAIEKHRKEKEDFFSTSDGSPFVQKNTEFNKLAYFTPNSSFKVSATLEKMTKRELLSIGNSDGTQKQYLKFATAHFKLNGSQHSLLILKSLGFGNQYLTAFADETSGISTYGGGRYLDLKIGKSDKVEIDFNKAYNPYCAYFPDFLCPLPPRENILSIAIEAGEKDFKSQ